MSGELLNWLNATVHGRYENIEELRSGVAYCQIMEQLFPKCIGRNNIKTNAISEYEFFHNLNLLQDAFNCMGFEKKIPIEDLEQGSSQANLLALARNNISPEPIQKPTTKTPIDSEQKPSTSQASSESSERMTSQLSHSIKRRSSNKTKPTLVTSMARTFRSRDNAKPDNAQTRKQPKTTSNRKKSPSFQVLSERVDQLREQFINVEYERKYYLEKFKKIELLLQESIKKQEFAEFRNCVFKILHAVDAYKSTKTAIDSSKD
ncbi:microtubule-associated protein RP/EB family member 3-like isoform X2 [Glossina fuscipes]|uniref:Microtubule-associated protein RP/EB family member 3-like isoform X2 n=1 Tax=Glossina fuscipes TaxID=7396 RepID=A0A8U0WM07_9MUSC|nr:microtubule-associated protein RP/EB family member 3-like isoform X2 [Glossina fuscipes]